MSFVSGRLCSLIACCAVLAACGRAAPGADDTSPLPRTVVVVAHGSEPGHLNPGITTSGNVHPVTDQIFNGLVGLDEKLEPVPELAERWDVDEGGRRYVFRLRPNVRWHDGTRLTSADVLFTFNEVLLKYHSRTRAGLGPSLDRIDTPDEATVVFHFRRPYAPLLQRLDVVEASILPKHVYGEGDLLNHPANQRPVGTGPFRFVRYARGDRVELERNRDYFRAGRPAVDGVVFRIMPSPATAVLALERGEVDYLSSVPGPDFERLQRTAGIRVAQSTAGSGGSFCQEVLIPNLGRPPLDRLTVRRAIYHAIDRQFLLERVYFGQGTPATGPISRALAWAYSSETRAYPHDVPLANRLLDEAGLRAAAGRPRVRLTFTHPANQARLAEVLREQLKAIGVDLALEPLDFNAAADRVFVRKTFDLGFASYCNGPDPDIGVRRVYSSANIGPIPFSNGAGYRSATADRLFDEAAATLDRQARAAIYARLQRVIAEDLPYFWLIDSAGYRAWRAEFEGFRTWTGAFLEDVRPVRR